MGFLKGYKPRKGGPRPRPKYSKVIVALVILMNVAFTAAVLFIYLQVGSEPKTLIAAWFAFTTGELWFLSGIKKKEIDSEKKPAKPPSDIDY